MSEDGMKRHIGHAILLIGILFFALILRIGYLQIVDSSFLSAHPLNVRTQESLAHLRRGNILDCNGEILAESRRNDSGEYKRHYPYGSIFAHLVGYYSDRIGASGLESYAGKALLGLDDPLSRLGPLRNLWHHDQGGSVRLTVDARIQEAAYRALGERRGAVVVINAKTGAILALVSKPDFDPNAIDAAWDRVRTDESSPLLNRAQQGLYPPGSIFKVLVADAALANSSFSLSQTYECPGFLKIGSYTLHEDHEAVHGTVDLKEALTVSCNTAFGQIAVKLGSKAITREFERFGFEKAMHNEMDDVQPALPALDDKGDGELAQIGVGQGDLLVNPLRMALVAATFANRGVMMKPYAIDAMISSSGDIIKEYSAERWLETTDPKNAQMIFGFMQTVVEKGTGVGANVPGVRVAGKTGTAENASGQPHAWFIGSAEFENMTAAFAVIVENGGSGGKTAAPIAREIIADMLNRGVTQ